MAEKGKLSGETFEGIVEQAISRIPEELARYLDNVLISVQRRPGEDLLREMGYDPDEVVFGVFSGVPITERSPLEPPLYPATIYLFQEPLESLGLSRDELIEEIEITVVHELAHYFGFDDEELEDLGYG